VERGPQAGADQQVQCRLERDGPDATGPFLARVQTGCFRAVGCWVAVRPERQEVRRWNRDVAAARWSVARWSERQAHSVPEHGAHPGAELPLAAAVLVGDPLVGALSAQPVALTSLALPAWQALLVLGTVVLWARSPPAPPQARWPQPWRMLPAPRQPSWLPLSWLAPS